MTLMGALLPVLLLTAAPTPRETARADFNRGEALFSQQRPAAARDAFLASFKAMPLGATAWNLGRCAEALGEAHEAIGWYRRYLRLDPTAADRPVTEGRIRALEQKLAKRGVQALTVFAEPADAQVLVDGKAVGQGTVTVELPPGSHVVQARAEGYADSRLEVELARAVSQGVALTLSPVAAPGPAPGRRPLVTGGTATTPPPLPEPGVPSPPPAPGPVTVASPEPPPESGFDGAGRPTRVYVHLDSPDPDTRLMRLVGTTTGTETRYVNGRYQPVSVTTNLTDATCLSPCNQLVPAPTDYFYVMGKDTPASRQFTLHQFPLGVDLRVVPGSSAGMMAGILLGSLAGTLGLMMTIGGTGAPSDAKPFVIGAGVGVLIGGVWGSWELFKSSFTQVWGTPRGGRGQEVKLTDA